MSNIAPKLNGSNIASPWLGAWFAVRIRTQSIQLEEGRKQTALVRSLEQFNYAN